VDTVITISVGLATRVGNTDDDVTSLIGLADKLLYQAKHTGRGQVCSGVLTGAA
jgi:PleD family two-component response regulator